MDLLILIQTCLLELFSVIGLLFGLRILVQVMRRTILTDSLGRSLIFLTFKYLILLLIAVVLTSVLAIIIATGRQLVFNPGGHDEMGGFAEGMLACIAFMYIVVPVAIVAFALELAYLVRGKPIWWTKSQLMK